MINLNEYSWSIRNSYISVTKCNESLLFRNVGNGDDDLCTLFEIDLKQNGITKLEAKLGIMKLYNQDKVCNIYFDRLYSLVFDSEFKLKLGFSPKKYEFASKIEDKILSVNLYSKRSKLLIVSECEVDFKQNWNVISSEDLKVSLEHGISKISLSNNNFARSCFELASTSHLEQKVEDDFKQFWNVDNIDYESKLFESKYILWSGFVHAKGNLKYDACYMSMNIMTNIWSWDNCFVSLGLAKEQPKRAYEQFMSFAHVQSEEGNFPDFMNPDYVSYDFTKPPIQGVLYLELLNLNPNYFGETSRLKEVYSSCQKLLNYWLDYRIFNNTHKLPFNTHGNDTGLDNATIFDQTVTVRSPDLIVYLVKLLELVGFIEQKLNMNQGDYEPLETKLLDELCNRMFDGRKYVSYDVFTNQVNSDSMSIIEIIPLIIYDKLPKVQQQKLLENVENFLTEYGLASEAPSSKYYKSDGYWRGPIWAPTTCLCYLGLKNNNLDQGQIVKTQYIKMCEQYGFAENFNALTGVGLSDKAFAWTSAVYKYLKEQDV